MRPGSFNLVWALGLAVALGGAPTEAASEPAVPYRFILYPSPAGHAEQGIANLSDATRLASRGIDELAIRLWEPAAESVGLGVASRAMELSLVQMPVTALGVMLSHEIFGHGARARELGFDPSYEFRPPPPYYLPIHGGSAFTLYGPRDLPPTLDEELVLTLGGPESDELQVRHVELNGFRTGQLRQGALLLYLGNRFRPGSSLVREGNDRARYSDLIAARYAADRESVREELETATWISLVDPLFIYAWYALFVPMVAQGERVVAYPALEIGGAVRLSGGYRPLPVPWGLEHQVTALVGGDLGSAALRLRLGQGPGEGSFAVQLDVRDVPVHDRIAFGASVELWSQPELILASDLQPPAGSAPSIGVLGLSTGSSSSRLVGGAAQLVAEYHCEPWLWGMQVGGKTEGLRAGLPLANDAYGAAFAGVQF